MKTKWIAVLSIIAGIVVVSFMLKDLVSYYLIRPIVIALRIEQILVRALPQVVFWAMFLIVGFFLTIHTLRLRRKPIQDLPQSNEKWESRARQFSKWVRSSEKSDYSRWMLVRQLTELACDVFMYQERISPQDVREFFRKNKSTIPKEVREFLLAGLDVPSFRHYSEMDNNYNLNLLTSPLNIDPDDVIDFLEMRLKTGGIG